MKQESRPTKIVMEFGLPGKKRNYRLEDMSLSPIELAKGLVAKHSYVHAVRILTGLAQQTFGSGPAQTPNPSFVYYSNALGYLKNRNPKAKAST